jgi:hypothetical protein
MFIGLPGLGSYQIKRALLVYVLLLLLDRGYLLVVRLFMSVSVRLGSVSGTLAQGASHSVVCSMRVPREDVSGLGSVSGIMELPQGKVQDMQRV